LAFGSLQFGQMNKKLNESLAAFLVSGTELTLFGRRLKMSQEMRNL
jgi:hypothetical protein